jgi:hypothetical protein
MSISKTTHPILSRFHWPISFAAITLLLSASFADGQTLLDEKWTDGSRAENKLPNEAAVWIGRPGDVKTNAGGLSIALTPSSQKLWAYFSEKDPITLAVGQELRASVSFVPRGKLSESTSRSLRIGLFHDSTSPRVDEDRNSDAGGQGAPWSDAKGYAVQVLVAGGEYAGAKPFDIGKRVNLQSQTLLGASGDYAKVSGGQPVALTLDQEYTVVFNVERTSEAEVVLTAAYRQGDQELSTWSVTDDGSSLGSEPINDKFDMLFIRISNAETTADKLDFTNLKVELVPAITP